MRRRLAVSQRFEPAFHRTSTAFEVLGPAITRASSAWRDWPAVSEYDAWSAELEALAGRGLRFREADRARVATAGGYDGWIEETGLIPTRARSWHDFFNACIWARFPRSKLAVHRLQLRESRHRPGPFRTQRQNWLTHFDECGVLVLSSRPELASCIERLAWRELFLERRAAFGRQVRVWCFGHATLEALREPYVGLMGKAVVLHEPALEGDECAEALLRRADQRLAALLDAATRHSEGTLPRLSALPVLGLPGWHAANERASFYDQEHYFRTGPARGPTLASSSGAQ